VGLHVSATDAARLVRRTPRTIRNWIVSGRLPAEAVGVRERTLGVGPNQWRIDIDDLREIPGVHLDPVVLARLETIEATRTGTNVLERVERLERLLGTLQAEVAEVRRQLGTLRAEQTDHQGGQ